MQTIRANGSIAWHAIYDSMILMERSGRASSDNDDNGDLSGVLRTFSPASESNFPPDSLINVHGKFALPPNSDKKVTPEFIIESINHSVFSGNPGDDTYDSFLPLDNTPTIVLLGSVIGGLILMDDGAKAVDVRVSNFIQNKTLDCIYR